MAIGTDIYQLKLFSRDGGGNFFQNVSHWLVQPDGTDDPFTTAKALADAWNTSLTPLLAPCMSSDGNIDALFSRKIGPTAGGNTYTKTINTGGTVVQATHSGAIAINLNEITDDVSAHGHWYIGGIPETFVVDDAVTGAALTPCHAFTDALITQLTWGGAGTANLAIYTRKTKVATPVIAIEVNASPAVLKRRVRPFG